MSNLRFAVLTIVLFAGAFASMAWASKGFPLPGFMSASVEPASAPKVAAETPAPPKITHETMSVLNQPNLVTVPLPVPNPLIARAPGFEDSVKEERKELAKPKSAPEKSAQRDKEQAPVDTDPGRVRMRQTTIQAAGAYAYAPCDPAIKAAFVVATTTYVKAVTEKINNAGTYATPMDRRVRESIQTAFGTGGITAKDFPAGTQNLITAIAKTDGSPAAPCAMGRRADRAR